MSKQIKDKLIFSADNANTIDKVGQLFDKIIAFIEDKSVK
jgi:hypothetical protein